ncbi:MAG: 2-amino-4-hydroxy-6-hydroxymethyldihydropteridine diphosphokinase [Pseudomonadales bacterium]|jgi:2-amino-4-hydroxy-6-hydroxymethyldihydropteridine diphosphokinase
MNTAYIALGANLGNPLSQLNQAIALLNTTPHISVITAASIYQSTAIGPGEQPDYLNSVMHITTMLGPDDLLAALHTIETNLGRVRTVNWGARTLDLDLLLYDQFTSTTLELTVPHPRMCERNFVIYPLLEITTALILPNGLSVETIAQKLVNVGIQRKNSFNSQRMQWMT